MCHVSSSMTSGPYNKRMVDILHGLYASWKTWKVLECEDFKFQAWKVLEFHVISHLNLFWLKRQQDLRPELQVSNGMIYFRLLFQGMSGLTHIISCPWKKSKMSWKRPGILLARCTNHVLTYLDI